MGGHADVSGLEPFRTVSPHRWITRSVSVFPLHHPTTIYASPGGNAVIRVMFRRDRRHPQKLVRSDIEKTRRTNSLKRVCERLAGRSEQFLPGKLLSKRQDLRRAEMGLYLMYSVRKIRQFQLFFSLCGLAIHINNGAH